MDCIEPNQSQSWDMLFAEINTDDQHTVDTLVEAAIYSISAVEALDQIQARTDNLDSEMFDTSLEANITYKQEKKTLSCYSCGGNLKTKNNVMICQDCGLEIQNAVVSTNEDESTTVSQDSNVNDKGFVSMKVVGAGSYGLNKSLLQNCADYTRYRKMTTLKEMHNWNAQSDNHYLPKNIIEEANEMFATIKDHNYVFRKDVKKGVQGACLYYACHLNGISRTPAEISKIVGIAEKFLSAGDRHLRDLNERGIIKIPAKINAINSYINRYFELLKIPVKYKGFVLEMIEQADEDRLHVLYDSKSNTKCIGTIYMLIDRIPELKKQIDKDRIEKDCEISKTTFIKYYTMLCKYYRKFAHIFAKYQIKMKSEWREDITDVKPKTKPRVYKTKKTEVSKVWIANRPKKTVKAIPEEPEEQETPKLEKQEQETLKTYKLENFEKQKNPKLEKPKKPDLTSLIDEKLNIKSDKIKNLKAMFPRKSMNPLL